MAYMNQEKKAVIAAALKKVVPKGWKYSLKCDRHSISMNIKSAPIDLLKSYQEMRDEQIRVEPMRYINVPAGPIKYAQVNPYHFKREFGPDVVGVVEKIIDAMNSGNHDNSDIQSDYFDVGHYIHINIGGWDKPFVVV